MRSAILGIGHYVPSKAVTNDDLAKLMNTSDEWNVQRTGIKERRYTEHSGNGASDLAVPASKMAL
jgi:3-oxoacyl-[acyl-carrier-protein] synthase-3